MIHNRYLRDNMLLQTAHAHLFTADTRTTDIMAKQRNAFLILAIDRIQPSHQKSLIAVQESLKSCERLTWTPVMEQVDSDRNYFVFHRKHNRNLIENFISWLSRAT